MPDLYNPGTERLQVTASPNLITQSAPQADRSNQLLAALGMAEPAVHAVTQHYEQEQAKDATAWAHSLTVDELGNKIKSGELLPSQSPAFVATVHHIYGQNLMEAHQQDTLSKIGRGELQFASNEDLQAYLVKQRNEAMAGQSDYAVAGYDTGLDQFTARATSLNSHITDAAFVQRGAQEASDNLGAIVDQVTLPDFTGGPQVAAQAVMQRFQLLADTKVLLTPDQKKDAWANTLNQLAEGGHREVLSELLKTKTPDGFTVASVVGGQQSRALENAARSTDAANQRRRLDVEIRPFWVAAEGGLLEGAKRRDFDDWFNKNEQWLTTPQYQAIVNAQRAAADRLERENAKANQKFLVDQSRGQAESMMSQAIARGALASLPDPMVYHRDGTWSPANKEAFANLEIPRQVTQNKLAFPQEVQLWSANGVESPQIKATVGAGVSNLASVGWAADGKNVGVLNEQGKRSLDKFSQLAQVNPEEADKYAGPNKELLGDILLMQQRGGMPDINTAAAFVNQSRRSGISTEEAAAKQKDINAAVHDLTDSHFWSLSDNSIANTIRSMFGTAQNETLNFENVAADIRREALLLTKATGMTPQEAVKDRLQYLANPQVTAKVNGTLYYTKDLPMAPKGEDRGEWLSKFIQAEPQGIATRHGLSAVRLQPLPQGGYQAWVGGTPLPNESGQGIVTYTKAQVSDWITKQYQHDLTERAAASNYDAFKERLTGTTFGKRGLLEGLDSAGEGTGALMYGPPGSKQPVSVSDLTSKKTFDLLRAQGVATNGTRDEILQAYLNTRKKK